MQRLPDSDIYIHEPTLSHTSTSQRPAPPTHLQSSSTGKSVDNTIISNLLDKGAAISRSEPRSSPSLSGKGTWHPRIAAKIELAKSYPLKPTVHNIRVIEIPEGHAHTSGIGNTATNGSSVVIELLDLLGIGHGEGAADIELSEGDLDGVADGVDLRSVGGDGLVHGGDGRGAADGEVGLHADTIDADTGRGEVADECCGVGSLRSWPFNTVIVIIQLDGEGVVGDDLGGLLEGELDVVGSDVLIPDVGSPWVGCGWAITEGFVDDVPVGTVVAYSRLASDGQSQSKGRTKVCNERLDVGVHDGQEGSAVPGSSGEPAWELLVPEEVVAANDGNAAALGKRYELVGTGEVEDTLLGLSEFVLHDVGGCPLVEFVVISGHGHVDRVRALASAWVVYSGTKVASTHLRDVC
jgi:hypothetical protein